MSANRLVMCPYDEAHKVKESRLQLHITKCRQNHLNEEKFICPFNATHVHPRQERDYHLLHCPDSAPLDRMMAQNVDRNNPYKGRTAVPSYSASAPVVSEEVWEIDTSRVGPGYQPPSERPVDAIFEPPPNSKPAERRKMYQVLHQEREGFAVENRPLPTIATPPVAKPQPKQPSKPSILQSQMQNYQNLGLGRGRGVAPSRIAANIFPPQAAQSNPAPTEPNYVSAMSSGLSNLGLGRGQAPVAQPNFFNDDEFPALGCGRGINRAPGNNNSYAGVMGNKR